MQRSIRLEAILAWVLPCDRAADIGTDHAYLPIELVRRGVCREALALDVRSGPLARAQAHIEQAGLEAVIHTRLSDGLDRLQAGEADAVIMAGMGGRLIQQIMERAGGRPQLWGGIRQLLLQPQSEAHVVRHAVHRQGLRIERECLIQDRGQYYWILDCRPGHQQFEKDWQYVYGEYLPARRDAVLLAYLERQRNTISAIMRRLENENSEIAQSRKEALRADLAMAEEVYTQCKK